MVCAGIRRRSNRWHRLRMVGRTLCGSVVAKMKITCEPAVLPDVFSSALNACGRQHVNLVNDVDFEFAAGREAHIIAKFANLIHAIVACAVDLQHIEVDPLRDLPAGIADSARVDGRALDAVHGLGQNAGGRGFARAARPDEKVSVSQALLLNGILQRSNNVILA